MKEQPEPGKNEIKADPASTSGLRGIWLAKFGLTQATDKEIELDLQVYMLQVLEALRALKPAGQGIKQRYWAMSVTQMEIVYALFSTFVVGDET